MNELLDELRDLWDPWASLPAPIPHFLFGSGSRRPFRWYFEGPTRGTTSSPAEMELWLHGCTYTRDEHLFGRDDHWMHPGEFEVIRMGDCDDHALWAWRRFAELGYETSLVRGKWKGDPSESHIYVLVTIRNQEFVFESTCKTLGQALRPLDEARGDYLPEFSVNQRFQTRAYVGAVQDLLHLSDDW